MYSVTAEGASVLEVARQTKTYQMNNTSNHNCFEVPLAINFFHDCHFCKQVNDLNISQSVKLAFFYPPPPYTSVFEQDILTILHNVSGYLPYLLL